MRRAKAAADASSAALLEQLAEQQEILSQLQALPSTESGDRGSDTLQQRRRENLRRREVERVTRLAKGAARAEELEQQLLRQVRVRVTVRANPNPNPNPNPDPNPNPSPNLNQGVVVGRRKGAEVEANPWLLRTKALMLLP